MKKYTALFLLAFTGFATPALACSCMQSSRQEAIDNADVVFTGTVEKVERDGFWNVATIKVDDVTKGTVDEEATVTTATHSAACGIEFVVGQSIELAAIQRKDRLHADLCSQLGLKN